MNSEKAFGLLGIVPGDSLEMVKAKYRIKAKQCHPDRFAHDLTLMKAAEVEMTQINLAYQVACTQLKSFNGFYGTNGDSVDGKNLIPWLSLLNWSVDLAKPLLKKAMDLFYFKPGHEIQSGHPEKPVRENCLHTHTAKKSFDAILQQKVADMKNSQHDKK